MRYNGSTITETLTRTQVLLLELENYAKMDTAQTTMERYEQDVKVTINDLCYHRGTTTGEMRSEVSKQLKALIRSYKRLRVLSDQARTELMEGVQNDIY